MSKTINNTLTTNISTYYTELDDRYINSGQTGAINELLNGSLTINADETISGNANITGDLTVVGNTQLGDTQTQAFKSFGNTIIGNSNATSCYFNSKVRGTYTTTPIDYAFDISTSSNLNTNSIVPKKYLDNKFKGTVSFGDTTGTTTFLDPITVNSSSTFNTLALYGGDYTANITDNNHLVNKKYVDDKLQSSTDLNINDITANGNLTVIGNATIGDTNSDTLTINSRIAGTTPISYSTDITSNITDNKHIVTKKYVDGSIVSNLQYLAQWRLQTTKVGSVITQPTFNGSTRTFNLSFPTGYLYYECYLRVDYSYILSGALPTSTSAVVPTIINRTTSIYHITINTQTGSGYSTTYKNISCDSAFFPSSSVPISTVPTDNISLYSGSTVLWTPVTFGNGTSSNRLVLTMTTPTLATTTSQAGWIVNYSCSAEVLNGTTSSAQTYSTSNLPKFT